MTNELLLDGRLRQRGIFNHAEVTRLWQEHRSGQGDHRHRLWQLIMLELWFRAFIDGAGKRQATAVGAQAPRAAPRVAVGLKGSRDMCGIAGIVASDRLSADDRRRMPRMRDVIAHRGPDDAGVFLDDRAALGHRRLSIVDLAAGHQPLSNEDGTIWIVFNGEIYNHADVRPELEAAGHRYRTRSDTETIVHAYEQWGDACVEHLRGHVRLRDLGCAAAAAAARARSPGRQAALLGAGRRPAAVRLGDQVDSRERPGSRGRRRGAAAGAAEHALPVGGRDPVQGHPSAAARTHAGVRAGTGSRSASTGTFPPAAATSGWRRLSDQDAVRQFRELLEQAVRIRLMADVPLGMFLSGGLDSSAIAALISQRLRVSVAQINAADEPSSAELGSSTR